jgi:hypothetical protein
MTTGLKYSFGLYRARKIDRTVFHNSVRIFSAPGLKNAPKPTAQKR